VTGRGGAVIRPVVEVDVVVVLAKVVLVVDVVVVVLVVEVVAAIVVAVAVVVAVVPVGRCTRTAWPPAAPEQPVSSNASRARSARRPAIPTTVPTRGALFCAGGAVRSRATGTYRRAPSATEQAVRSAERRADDGVGLYGPRGPEE